MLTEFRLREFDFAHTYHRRYSGILNAIGALADEVLPRTGNTMSNNGNAKQCRAQNAEIKTAALSNKDCQRFIGSII